MKNIFQRVCIPSSLFLLLFLFSSPIPLEKKKRERRRRRRKSREKDRRYFRRRLVPEEQSPPPPLASLNYARSFISGGTRYFPSSLGQKEARKNCFRCELVYYSEAKTGRIWNTRRHVNRVIGEGGG